MDASEAALLEPVDRDGTPRRRPIGGGKRLVFAATTLVLGWLVCEAGGYLAFWLWNGSPFSWAELQEERRQRSSRLGISGILAQVHPYVGYVEEPRPESGVVRERDGRPVPVSDFGYLDDESPLQVREPDKVVVAIVGGSVASFFAIDGTRRLEDELSRSSEFRGKKFVFVNLALGGYKQPQQLMTLAYFLSIGAQFDVVLNLDGFNEVALYVRENAASRIYPPFPRSWQARVCSNNPAVGLTRGRYLILQDERDQLALRQSQAPWRYSVVCNIIWRYRDRTLERKASELVRASYKADLRRGPYAVTGPQYDFDDQAGLYDFLADIWANSSFAIHALCLGNGVRYFHFLQPNQYLPDSKPMGDEERRKVVRLDHPYKSGVETGYPLLLERGRGLKGRGVRFHDLSLLFAEHPEAIYRDDCCHLNQRGNDLMAEAVARAILDDFGLAPPG